MDQREPDPVFRNARREALIILGVYATALVYTVGYCYLFGYDRPALSVVSYWGIPSWVFWGVFAPWAVCAVFITGFTFFYMTDDDLGPDEVPDEGGADAR